MISKWRKEAAASGLHSQISTQIPRLLEPGVANELRGLDLEVMSVVDLQALARIMGVSPSGRKAEVKARLTPLIQSINATGNAVVSLDYPPIPWVFTKEQLTMVNTRCKRIVIPSTCPAFCSTKAGIFEDMSMCWR